MVFFHMDKFYIICDEKVMMNFLRCYSTPIDKTIQKKFTKSNLFSCTPIGIV